MITCKMISKMGHSKIIAPNLPSIGEMIYIEELGHALVERLFHNKLTLNNYIKVELQETTLGRLSAEYRFEIGA